MPIVTKNFDCIHYLNQNIIYCYDNKSKIPVNITTCVQRFNKKHESIYCYSMLQVKIILLKDISIYVAI